MASLLSLRQISRKGKKREGEKEREKKKRKNRITLHESTPHHRLHDNIRNDCVEFSLSLSSFIPFHDAEGGIPPLSDGLISRGKCVGARVHAV